MWEESNECQASTGAKGAQEHLEAWGSEGQPDLHQERPRGFISTGYQKQ